MHRFLKSTVGLAALVLIAAAVLTEYYTQAPEVVGVLWWFGILFAVLVGIDVLKKLDPRPC